MTQVEWIDLQVSDHGARCQVWRTRQGERGEVLHWYPRRVGTYITRASFYRLQRAQRALIEHAARNAKKAQG